MKIVENWKKLHKAYSVVLMNLSLMCLVLSDVLPIWKGIVEPETYKYVAAILGTLAILSRYIKQDDLHD